MKYRPSGNPNTDQMVAMTATYLKIDVRNEGRVRFDVRSEGRVRLDVRNECRERFDIGNEGRVHSSTRLFEPKRYKVSTVRSTVKPAGLRFLLNFQVNSVLWHLSDGAILSQSAQKLFASTAVNIPAADKHYLEQGFLKFASITPGGIEIRCWGNSVVFGSKVQIQTQALIRSTRTFISCNLFIFKPCLKGVSRLTTILTYGQWGAKTLKSTDQDPVFSITKFYTEKIFVWVRMQLRKHVDTRWSVTRVMQYTCNVNFGMLQVRENEISLRKRSGGTAHLRTLEKRFQTEGPKQDYRGSKIRFSRLRVWMFLDVLFFKRNEIYESLQVVLIKRTLSSLSILANVTNLII